jgi:hypothetical protein
MNFIVNVAEIGGAFTLPESTYEGRNEGRKEVLYPAAHSETTMTNHITTRIQG